MQYIPKNLHKDFQDLPWDTNKIKTNKIIGSISVLTLSIYISSQFD